MSEAESQETNGTTNGDVPEIELIIKEECFNTNATIKQEEDASASAETQTQHTAYELKPNIIIIKSASVAPELNGMHKIYIQYAQQEIRELKLFTDANNCAAAINVNSNDNNKSFRLTTAAAAAQPTACGGSNSSSSNSSGSVGNTLHLPESDAAADIKKEKRSTTASPANDSYGGGESNASIEQMDFASVVAEACEGLFDDIENELDLHLTTDNETDNDDTTSSEIIDYTSCRGKNDSEAMQLAVAAVLEGGMSLGQAAKKYNVVKSTVWARVSKHPKHRRRKTNKELGELIHSKLSAGVSLSEISRTLNVAKSTVHQHKTRLTKHGMLPTVLSTCRRGGSHSSANDNDYLGSNSVQARLSQAYRGYTMNGMSVRFAAEFYSLPLTTLWRYIKRRQADANSSAEIVPKTEPNLGLNEDYVRTSSEKTAAHTDDNTENIRPASADDMTIKAEIDPQDQPLFEQAMLNQLFE